MGPRCAGQKCFCASASSRSSSIGGAKVCLWVRCKSNAWAHGVCRESRGDLLCCACCTHCRFFLGWLHGGMVQSRAGMGAVPTGVKGLSRVGGPPAGLGFCKGQGGAQKSPHPTPLSTTSPLSTPNPRPLPAGALCPVL